MGILDLFRRRTALKRVEHSGVGGTYGAGDELRWGSTIIGGMHPGSDTNWAAKVKDPAINATVHACLRWVVENVAEPEPMVYRRVGRQRKEQEDSEHEALELLLNPNEDYDGVAMLQAAAVSYMVTGNAYLLKERDNLGRVKALWWKPEWSVHPVWPNDGSQFRAGYVYRPAGRGGMGTFYDKKDVIHFQWALDRATEGRFGMHRTMPVYREIAALNEMSTYMAVLPENMAIVPYLLSPKDGSSVNEESAKSLARMWSQFTRDRRGKPAVPSIPLEATKLGLTPEEMALDKLPRLPSLAVCGAFGIHPAVIFLSTDPKGLDNGGQQEQARKQSYHDCLIPLLKRFGRTLSRALLPDFDASALRQSRTRIGFDFGGVEALAEDKDSLHTREREDYKVGGIDRYEFREATGREAREEDKGVYFAGPEKDEADHELAQEAADAEAERAKSLSEPEEDDDDDE
jgi:phage portal protein BeeE